jgi:SP family arabinose:H+ symporter-like MFS transporter
LFAVIEKYGRKKATIFFTFMMGLSFMILGIFVNFDGFSVVMMICIDLFLCFFAVSLGPICWIYTSETMTDKGMAFGAALNWGTATLIVWCFPSSVTYFGISSTFLLFSFLNTISVFYFIFDMIETKGLAKEQIREILKNMR